MRAWGTFLAVIVVATLGVAPALAQAPGARVALVIGNGDYAVLPFVPSAKPDAGAVTAAFRTSGFVVTVATDLRRDELADRIEAFGATVAGAEVAIVYFSGQALDAGGAVYLLPTDAAPERAEDLDRQAVAVVSVLDAIAGASAIRMVIVDADLNPFLSPGAEDRAGMVQRQRDPEPGSVVLLTALPGRPRQVPEPPMPGVAAVAILRELSAPEVTAAAFVTGVIRRILAATDNAQTPQGHGIPGDNILFRGGP